MTTITDRPDLDLTDEEFVEFLRSHFDKVGPSTIFDCLTPDYILTSAELTDLLESYSGTISSMKKMLERLDETTVKFSSLEQKNLFNSVMRDIKRSYHDRDGEKIQTSIAPNLMMSNRSEIRYSVVRDQKTIKTFTFYIEEN